MKKIIYYFTSLTIVFSFFGTIGSIHAEDSSIQKVYLVKVYEKDPWIGNYTLTQLGSAVAISDTKLVTNAHVILNSDTQEPYQYIELCETVSIKKAPRCFGVAKLINYDSDKDLALLQSPKKLSVSVLASTDPKVKQKVSTIGYPNNGGSTVTVTQGIIAGYEDNHYKIDANIDHGNSGGGSYNEAGELVGIPVFYVEGGTALGYMIPSSTVKTFLKDNKNTKAISTNNDEFASFLKKSQSMVSKQTISNKFFNLKLKNSGFELVSESKDADSGIASYTLKHKDNKSYLTISTSANDNLEFDLAGHTSAMEKFKDDFKEISYQSGSKNGMAREYLKLSKSKYDKKSSMISYSINTTTNNDISLYLFTQSSSTSSEQDFKKLINKIEPLNTKPLAPRRDFGTILLPDSIKNGVVGKHYSIESYGNWSVSFDLRGKFSDASFNLTPMDDYSVDDQKKKSFQFFGDQMVKSIQDIYEGTIIKQGFVKSDNSKSRRYIVVSNCAECEVHRIWAYSFVTNPNDKKLYLVSISFEHSMESMTDADTNTVLDYLSTIDLNSTIAYTTNDIVRKTFGEFKNGM